MSDTTSEASGPDAAAKQPDAVPAPPGRRRGLLALAAVLAVVLVGLGVLGLVGSSPTAPSSSVVGTLLPAFSLPGVDGGVVTMPWASGHPAVVVMFASWCAPCHKEVPRVARLVGRGDLGAVRVVGLDGDVADPPAAAFLASSHVRFPVGHDATLAWSNRLTPDYPATAFVSASGTVRAIVYGSISNATLLADAAALR